MPLPAKFRISIPKLELPVPVEININRVPIRLNYMAPKWDMSKTLYIRGTSIATDLIDDSMIRDLGSTVSAKQYVLSDEDGNMYEAFIIVTSHNSENYVGKMHGIYSIPKN